MVRRKNQLDYNKRVMHLGVTYLMLNKSFSSGPIVMHLGVTLAMLNQSFSLGATVIHLGLTNCHWSNFIDAEPIV